MLSVEEAAERLGVPPGLVSSWCLHGILPHVRSGGPGGPLVMRVDPDELEGFIAGMMPQEAPPNPGDVLTAKVNGGGGDGIADNTDLE